MRVAIIEGFAQSTPVAQGGSTNTVPVPGPGVVVVDGNDDAVVVAASGLAQQILWVIAELLQPVP